LLFCSCISDAKSFLTAHGIHYADGSKNIEPAQLFSFDALKSTVPSRQFAHTSTNADGHVKQEPQRSDAMDIDETKQETGTITDGIKAAVLSPADQLRAFLDAIPDA
jgi:hypothetical protein